MSDRVGEHSEHGEEENSPMTARVKLCNPGDSADVLAASRSIEDIGKQPKKLCKVSKCVSKHSERKDQQDLPGRPQDSPEDLGSEIAVPGGVHDVWEHPRNVSSECTDEMDAPGRVTGPGGYLELQEESEVIEGELDCANIVDSAGHNGISLSPKSSKNMHGNSTNMPCRDNQPRGHMGEQVKSRDIKGDLERQSDVEADQIGGRRGWKDNIMSSAHSNLI